MPSSNNTDLLANIRAIKSLYDDLNNFNAKNLVDIKLDELLKRYDEYQGRWKDLKACAEKAPSPDPEIFDYGAVPEISIKQPEEQRNKQIPLALNKLSLHILQRCSTRNSPENIQAIQVALNNFKAAIYDKALIDELAKLKLIDVLNIAWSNDAKGENSVFNLPLPAKVQLVAEILKNKNKNYYELAKKLFYLIGFYANRDDDISQEQILFLQTLSVLPTDQINNLFYNTNEGSNTFGAYNSSASFSFSKKEAVFSLEGLAYDYAQYLLALSYKKTNEARSAIFSAARSPGKCEEVLNCLDKINWEKFIPVKQLQFSIDQLAGLASVVENEKLKQKFIQLLKKSQFMQGRYLMAALALNERAEKAENKYKEADNEDAQKIFWTLILASNDDDVQQTAIYSLSTTKINELIETVDGNFFKLLEYNHALAKHVYELVCALNQENSAAKTSGTPGFPYWHVMPLVL